MYELKRKIQTVVICGLLLFSSIDFGECRKTANNNKNKGKTAAATARPKQVSQQTHANPASLSYSGVNPNAPQQTRPSAPKLDQKPVQPAMYPQSSNANARPVGWDVNSQQQRPQSPYPVNNQPRPQSPPYPVNQQPQLTQQHSPPYPQNSPSLNQNPAPHYPQNPAPHYPQNPAPQYPQNPAQQYPQNPAAHYPQNPAQQYPQNPAPHYPQNPTNFNQNPAQHYPQNQPQYNPSNFNHNPPPQNYNPNPQGYNPNPGYNPGYVPQQPHVVHHQIVPVQSQQSSGPSLLKTAAVGAAAGLGTAALYNAFSSKDEPKTTVIIVNNTQPAAPAPAENPAPAPAPVQNSPAASAPVQEQTQYPQQPLAPAPNNQYPIQEQPQYPQQYPPQNNQYPQYPQQHPQNSQYPVQEQSQYPPQPLPVNPEQPLISNGENQPFVPPPIDSSQITAENPSMTTVSVNNTEGSTEVQSTPAVIQSDISTVAATTVAPPSTPDKAVNPVDALSSRATESANLKDNPSNNQPLNTQLSMLILALSFSLSYLVQ